MLSANIDPGVPVTCSGDLVGQVLDVLLHCGVVELPADESLRCEHSILRVGNSLSLGSCSHESLAVLGEGNYGGGRPCAFGVLEHLGCGAFHDGNTGVGGSEVYADDGVALGGAE